MQNVTIVVLFFSLALVLLGSLNSIQYAEGAVSWNGFLKQVGFNPPTVYEVSDVSVIPAGEGTQQGNTVQLRCLDGDWVLDDNNDPRDSIVLSTDTTSGILNKIIARGAHVQADEPLVNRSYLKSIGFDGFAESAGVPVTTPVTMTILCLSPSSMMTVGGEWIATDTTALII